MKISLLIIIIGIIIAGSVVFVLTFEYSFENEYYDIEIQGMKDSYHIGDEYSFYYILSGFGNTCGSWSVSYPDKNGVIQNRGADVDCTQIKNSNLLYDSRQDGREFNSPVPAIEGMYNVTASFENGASAVYTFTVLPKTDVLVDSEGDQRRHGYTPAFEYKRVQINGTIALQICSILKLQCTSNPVFDAIYRFDKNYTYFHYTPLNSEYLFKIYETQICYATDYADEERAHLDCTDIIYENKTNGFENKTSEVTGVYELDGAKCMGGQGMIINDKCQRIGNYDLQTGIPIVENKVQCDLLNGTWYDKQNKCDSKYAPVEYRLQFGYSFLGYDVPQICTYDMMIHLARHSSMFDEREEYAIEDIGLPENVNLDDFDICVDELLTLRSMIGQ